MTSITNSSINNAFEAFKTAASGEEQVKILSALKVTELRELAKFLCVRLTGVTRKADIIAAIIETANAGEQIVKKAAEDFEAAETEPEKCKVLDDLTLNQVEQVAEATGIEFADDAEVQDEPEDSLKAQFLADCFKDDLKACTKLSEVMKVINEFKLTAEKFVELVSPDVEIKLAGGALNAAVQYCEAFNLELDNSNELYEQKLGDLFDELVPSSGKADSVAGELVRATSRIAYRYYNDGDLLGVGYGRETVNPAGRFLRAYGNESIRHCVEHLWGALEDRDYKFYLHWLIQLVVDKVEFEPELKSMECESMEDWRDVAQDIDDEEFEYDDDRVMLIEKFLKAKAAKLKAKRKAENNDDDDDPDDDPNNNAMRKPEAEVEDEYGQASAEFMAKLDELEQKGGEAPRSRNSELKADVLNKSADELQKILNGDLSLSEKEAVLDGCGKNLLRQLYMRYVKQPLTDSMDKFTMIRDIMFSIELDTPDLIDFDVKKRMLKAGSKAERIEILERCTRYALLDFAKWKHESLNDVPEISPEIEDRRSVLAKCIARLKDLSAAD